MKRSHFTTLLILAILMTIGAAVLPLIDTGEQPRARQGRRLTVSYSWNGASAKVIEQNVTSKIEGLVSAVKGVQSTESRSYFGWGNVTIQLKPTVNISAVKFEILSLLRQTYKQLPKGVSYPNLSGGDIPNNSRQKAKIKRLLTYRINAGMTGNQLREYIQQHVEQKLRREEEIKRIDITGYRSKFIEITYDPTIIASYGISAHDIEQAIRSFMGREEIVGDVLSDVKSDNSDEKGLQRVSLYLATAPFARDLEQMPIKEVDGKMIYLNDLTHFAYKDRLPDSYFRVNGLNTIYLNIYVDADADKIMTSRKLRAKVSEVSAQLKEGVYLTLDYDSAKEAESELSKVIWRTLLALVILLVFVWVVSRSWKYLLIVSLALLANVLLSAIAYWLLDIRLHIYSLAGITVSIGIIIDATVVMIDHYSYYRNRRAFFAIFAALLTTIGSLVVVFWLPNLLQKNLYDFAQIIIINLTVALLVAYFFSPALIDAMRYERRGVKQTYYKRYAVLWKRFYTRYITWTQRHKWVYVLLLILAFGIPFYALPDTWPVSNDYVSQLNRVKALPWYAEAYNSTFGSRFFQTKLKQPLSQIFGGTMRLFAQGKSHQRERGSDERTLKLQVRAKMPLGGSVHELNDKVIMLEAFLSKFKEIKRFETRVSSSGASVDVEFSDEALQTSFPYELERKVIGRIITIGGADWSTRGVSERGFSNSLNLQYRNYSIELVGYNYDRLYRIAEDMCEKMSKNSRVIDLVIETPGFENQEDEFFMRYDKQRIALYDFNIYKAHQTLKEMFSDRNIPHYRDRYISADINMKPTGQDEFDLWHLNNAQIKVGDENLCVANFMDIQRREAKNCIPKRNQEYLLRVAFNLLGSYSYTSTFMTNTVEEFNKQMPVGFRCQNSQWGYIQTSSTQYWLLILVVVIIYFICAILFESLRQPLAILSLIPVSFIGAFLAYYFTGVDFGSGGFASLVLLCGLTVNAGIYIITEFGSQKHKNPIVAYVKAYNHKITAVFLTILSTVLGLIPFFINGKGESFWFSFAVGASGGLLLSVLALIFVMPIFLKLKN